MYDGKKMQDADLVTYLNSTDLRKTKVALIPRYSIVLHIALLTFKDKIRI
jgi:hypothetical protein